jgi:hypothetical protein
MSTSQRPREGHDRLDDHAPVGGSAERRDEALVDLELIQRETLQIPKVGIT